MAAAGRRRRAAAAARRRRSRADGHAFEVRLYAEDPARGFLPSIGRAAHSAAAGGAGTACASIPACEQGDAVTPFYDPMIAKMIAHGADRAAALRAAGGGAGRDPGRGRHDQSGASCAPPRPARPSGDARSIPAGSIARAPQSLAAERPADPATLLLAALATVALSLARPAPAPLPRHRLDLALASPRRLAAQPGAARAGPAAGRQGRCTSSPSRARPSGSPRGWATTSCTPAAASPMAGCGSRATAGGAASRPRSSATR